jgi:hypothetical protein
MDLGSIFLIIALLTLVGLFISQPLFGKVAGAAEPHSPGAPARDDQKHSATLAERDRVLNALSELDFDYAVGKIPEEDYPAQRNTLLEHGVRVLRELDTLEEGLSANAFVNPATHEKPAKVLEDPEDRLEAAIAARRRMSALADAATPQQARPHPGGRGPTADDDIETQIAARRRLRQEKSAGFCPQCGGPVQKSDRFCPKCGTAQKSMAADAKDQRKKSNGGSIA